jgi:2-aminoethylphosphonate-pyruvate transaminase
MNATRDPVLFTPGPLTTGRAVKAAMMRDVGSRDPAFVAVVAEIRRRLLAVAGVTQADGFEAVPLQGSGTYAVEAVISSATPPGGKWLVVSNGAYGDRIAEIAARHGIAHEVLRYSEEVRPDPADVERRLATDPTFTGVAAVHCETSTGMLNPIAEIGQVARRHGKTYAVDSMSAFGGIEFDLRTSGVDFLVSSANKCLEGVPGFAFVLCRTEALRKCRGQSRTLCLDLYDQWAALERTGQFRFTPPTHALLAFRQALDDLDREGGVAARARRYRRNQRTLRAGMRVLGFTEFLPPALQGPVITAFRYPTDGPFDFAAFYEGLQRRGFVIYPGKVSQADCFRIGTIGRISPRHVRQLLDAVREVLDEMSLLWDRFPTCPDRLETCPTKAGGPTRPA